MKPNRCKRGKMPERKAEDTWSGCYRWLECSCGRSADDTCDWNQKNDGWVSCETNMPKTWPAYKLVKVEGWDIAQYGELINHKEWIVRTIPSMTGYEHSVTHWSDLKELP